MATCLSNQWRTTIIGWVASILVLANVALGDDAPPVQPTTVRKVFADGKHNAFTALVRFKDVYYLAFRSGPSHGYGEADIVTRDRSA